MKPVKKKIEYYDYEECRKYLEERKGIKQHDPNNPYQDFWAFVIDIALFSSPDPFFYMDNSWVDRIYENDAWNKDVLAPILEEYLSEFGEGENRQIHFKAEY